MPPPLGVDDYDDDSPGENRAAAHITIILYFIVIYIVYCVRARICLRNGKNGFFCVRAASAESIVLRVVYLYMLACILYYNIVFTSNGFLLLLL